MSSLKAIYQEILVEIPEEYLNKINEYLDNYFINNLIGYYEIVYDEDEINFNNNKKKKILFYFPVNDEKARWELETILLSLNINDYFIEENLIQERNYWEDYKNSFMPFMVSKNFYLVPIWHKDNISLKDNIVPLYIEPGMAFGTGLHQSTQLMIQWIDENEIQNKIVLDAGCGSGILSIAALKKNAKLIYAFDIDVNAIESTKKNLSYNSLELELNNKIFLFECSWDDPRIINHYDIILANLTLPVFLKYQNYIKKISAETLVISGIGTEQIVDIEQIFQDAFSIKSTLEKDEWALVELRKK